MFDSVALDVVIGLVFIYLLYSLLATILSEMVATHLGLRARNLKEGIDRMLNDEEKTTFLRRIWDSLRLMKNPNNRIVNNFYDNPEIKYLGSSGIFSKPSSFKAVSFSKTLLIVLFGEQGLTREIIDRRLQEIIEHAANTYDQDRDKILDVETAKYINNMWMNSYGDIIKFKVQLEAWFDRTMEQCTEWYKRKMQVVLMAIGFSMAWIFNADTFVIISKLSVDKDARDKMVSMANAYVENNKVHQLDSTQTDANKKLDELLRVKNELNKDVSAANSLMGEGGWLPDEIQIRHDNVGKRFFIPRVDTLPLTSGQLHSSAASLSFDMSDKLYYFFKLLRYHFFGYLFTGFAISLGAPFWFDLLNKLMKLRTSTKHETNSTEPKEGQVSPLDREA